MTLFPELFKREYHTGADMKMDYSEKGNVLRFERTSIYDGQGLRTVLYLKGCPLNYLWCSTPESQKFNPELGCSRERCDGCGKCISVCPSEALSYDKDNKIEIDREKCTACFKCVDICPTNALISYGRSMTVEEVVREFSKDEIFYFHSNGGVTLSGGEVLMQPDFVRDILKECKMLGINTAIETCLISDYDSIQKILPWVDTIFIDIKMMDEIDHKRYVGSDNKGILEKIVLIDKSEYDLEMIIRIPLIPGINDSAFNMNMTGTFCSSLEKLKEIELLPYHRFGTETYSNLSKDYLLGDLKPPTEESLMYMAQILKSAANDKKVKVLDKYID
jgi:pyruvate formate lyase activating enzyme